MALTDGGFIFGGDSGLTYEQLKQRRAIAAALASRQQGFPKTKGEGMTYLGEAIGDALSDLGPPHGGAETEGEGSRFCQRCAKRRIRARSERRRIQSRSSDDKSRSAADDYDCPAAASSSGNSGVTVS
jgi:hypothetical protein